MGNTKTPATPTKEPTKTRSPKPATLLGYVLDYIDEHPDISEPSATIANLVESLRNDIVQEAMAGVRG